LSDTVLDIRSLTRCFGAFKAVDALTLSVNAGEVFALLGSNGAGKTTTIKMLPTLLPPTSGEAYVAGFPIANQAADVRLGLAYAHLIVSTEDDIRHGAVTVDLAALRREFQGPMIVANGFGRTTATRAVAEGAADAVAFGRLFIANPDLPKRFR
jgi:ABC-type branched-subunit amino acid transport system ATPase component